MPRCEGFDVIPERPNVTTVLDELGWLTHLGETKYLPNDVAAEEPPLDLSVLVSEVLTECFEIHFSDVLIEVDQPELFLHPPMILERRFLVPS